MPSLARALSALRSAVERGRPDQQVPVRRWHLRVLLDAYDRATMHREPAEPMRLPPPDCEPIVGSRYMAAAVSLMQPERGCGTCRIEPGCTRAPGHIGECRADMPRSGRKDEE